MSHRPRPTQIAGRPRRDRPQRPSLRALSGARTFVPFHVVGWLNFSYLLPCLMRPAESTQAPAATSEMHTQPHPDEAKTVAPSRFRQTQSLGFKLSTPGYAVCDQRRVEWHRVASRKGRCSHPSSAITCATAQRVDSDNTERRRGHRRRRRLSPHNILSATTATANPTRLVARACIVAAVHAGAISVDQWPPRSLTRARSKVARRRSASDLVWV